MSLIRIAKVVMKCNECQCEREHLIDPDTLEKACMVCLYGSHESFPFPFSEFFSFGVKDLPFPVLDWNDRINESPDLSTIQIFIQFLQEDIAEWAGKGYGSTGILLNIKANYEIILQHENNMRQSVL